MKLSKKQQHVLNMTNEGRDLSVVVDGYSYIKESTILSLKNKGLIQADFKGIISSTHIVKHYILNPISA